MFDWMPQNVKRILRIIAGFVLLVLGVICGFIPVLQGWIFILAGLALLSADFAWARLLRRKIRHGAQRAAAKLRRTRQS